MKQFLLILLISSGVSLYSMQRRRSDGALTAKVWNNLNRASEENDSVGAAVAQTVYDGLTIQVPERITTCGRDQKTGAPCIEVSADNSIITNMWKKGLLVLVPCVGFLALVNHLIKRSKNTKEEISE